MCAQPPSFSETKKSKFCANLSECPFLAAFGLAESNPFQAPVLFGTRWHDQEPDTHQASSNKTLRPPYSRLVSHREFPQRRGQSPNWSQLLAAALAPQPATSIFLSIPRGHGVENAACVLPKHRRLQEKGAQQKTKKLPQQEEKHEVVEQSYSTIKISRCRVSASIPLPNCVHGNASSCGIRGVHNRPFFAILTEHPLD